MNQNPLKPKLPPGVRISPPIKLPKGASQSGVPKTSVKSKGK